ncbi:MAG TPA: redoxin domain-containing protein [Gemmataceae bacterium]|nr:redoxin domain-containing protein [Gemmataceae bacterium]
MVELGELEAKAEEFSKRNTQVFAISIENQETVKGTQEKFPHLKLVADADHKLSDAVKAVPTDEVVNAPTTILVDGKGVVRWVFRPDSYLRRLSPEEVLAAVDEYAPTR